MFLYSFHHSAENVPLFWPQLLMGRCVEFLYLNQRKIKFISFIPMQWGVSNSELLVTRKHTHTHIHLKKRKGANQMKFFQKQTKKNILDEHFIELFERELNCGCFFKNGIKISWGYNFHTNSTFWSKYAKFIMRKIVN